MRFRLKYQKYVKFLKVLAAAGIGATLLLTLAAASPAPRPTPSPEAYAQPQRGIQPRADLQPGPDSLFRLSQSRPAEQLRFIIRSL